MIKLDGVKEFIKPTFLDYLRGGEQINVMVAVDYTGSNGDPRKSNSLHYIRQGVQNQYETALTEVCKILLDYDYDGAVDCYGFGAFPYYPHFKQK